MHNIEKFQNSQSYTYVTTLCIGDRVIKKFQNPLDANVLGPNFVVTDTYQYTLHTGNCPTETFQKHI